MSRINFCSFLRSGCFCAIGFLLINLNLSSTPTLAQRTPQPPRELRLARGFAPLVLRDGTIEHYYTEGDYGNQVLMCLRSRDGGETWLEPERVYPLPPEGRWAGRGAYPLIDRDGNLHLFFYNLARSSLESDTWHARRTKSGVWSKLQRVNPHGPQNPPIQLKSGRIIVALGYFYRNQIWNDPVPMTKMTVYYSDDSGESWHRSPDTLMVRVPETYQGLGAGGYEPVVVELNDGRVWMLIRTQTGWLYESFSKDGIEWSQPEASRFRSSDSPASIVRLPSGELVVFWNNNEITSPVDGRWMYTGRDALHAAISPDDGKTWRGFREVYLDPFRNENPPQTGDHGTAYPHAAAAPNGLVILSTGQSKGKHKLLRVDPAWLYEKHHEDDFSRGLDGWSVFKSYGPVSGKKRNRIIGAQRVPHPSRANAWVLHLRRPDEKSGDGATWNFPAGRSGKLTLRIFMKKGFGGGLITLTDRFIYPNDANLAKVIFALPLVADGSPGEGARLEPERWHTLELAWRVELDRPRDGWPGRCTVKLDGKEIGVRPQLNRARSGLSYLRLHSTAPAMDQAGFLIERVAVDVEP
jgi:hypothetical protein